MQCEPQTPPLKQRGRWAGGKWPEPVILLRGSEGVGVVGWRGSLQKGAIYPVFLPITCSFVYSAKYLPSASLVSSLGRVLGC